MPHSPSESPLGRMALLCGRGAGETVLPWRRQGDPAAGCRRDGFAPLTGNGRDAAIPAPRSPYLRAPHSASFFPPFPAEQRQKLFAMGHAALRAESGDREAGGGVGDLYRIRKGEAERQAGSKAGIERVARGRGVHDFHLEAGHMDDLRPARGHVGAVSAGLVDDAAHAQVEQVLDARRRIRLRAQCRCDGAQFGFVGGDVIHHCQHIFGHCRSRRGVEDDRLAHGVQAADGLVHHRQGDLMLQKEDVAVRQRGQHALQPLHAAFAVGGGHDDDVVLALGVDLNGGRACGLPLAHAHQRRIHAVFAEIAQVAVAKGVVAHAAGHAHGHAKPPQRHGLVGALAAGDGGEGSARQRLAGFGEALHARDDIHVDGTDDRQFFHSAPMPVRRPAGSHAGKGRWISPPAFACAGTGRRGRVYLCGRIHPRACPERPPGARGCVPAAGLSSAPSHLCGGAGAPVAGAAAPVGAPPSAAAARALRAGAQLRHRRRRGVWRGKWPRGGG